MKQPNAFSQNNDVFADIASQRVQLRESLLEQPQPPLLPEIVLPLEKEKCHAAFPPSSKMTTAAQLQEELVRKRRQYAPFMEDKAPALESCRRRINLLEFDWRLETEADQQDFSQVLNGEGSWETVTIPHYGGPLGKAVTYYRTTFHLSHDQMIRGAVFLCFKGVDYKAHVFVNMSYLGSHEGFFAPFEFDMTPHVREGQNTLTIKVENDFICMGSESSASPGLHVTGDKLFAATGPGYDDPQVGWHHCPPGMGIYQEVYLEIRAGLHVHDLFVRPIPEEQRAEAWIELYSCEIAPQTIALEVAVYGQNFEQEILSGNVSHPDSRQQIGLGDTFTEARLRARGEFDKPITLHMEKGLNYLRLPVTMDEFRLWEPETPWLYQLQVKVMDADGVLLDTAKQQFGMRSFTQDTESDPKGMLYLNGRAIRLRGANTMGHEQQCVINKDWNQLRDDLLLAKICNMNFLRLTQRPVQPEVYDFCDRLGLMTQTDLPLFGVLRRNQFCEAIRQAEEMERLIRSHPCNILISYINEPFPNAHNQPHRHLQRNELEDFFTAADLAVRLQNPDRVIKPVDGDYDPPASGLPDNHCYTAWYNGHGIDLGQLHKGYWQPVKPGWYYGCGEFGAEGLDPVNVMRKYYPKDWLPQNAEEERTWSPSRIIGAQTGKFHYLFFDTPDTLEDWVNASQEYQARAVRLMTEAFRRDSRMVSFAVHLFIDAFPSGWMKAIMDVDRQPKPAYFAYRDALTPLLANLRTDRFMYFVGETVKIEAWMCNDTQHIPEGASLRYQIEMGDEVIAAGTQQARIPACSSRFQGFLTFTAPDVTERTRLHIRLGVVDGGETMLHATEIEIEIFQNVVLPKSRRGIIVGPPDGTAAQLARDMGLSPVDDEQSADVDLVLIDDYEAFLSQQDRIIASVEQGAKAIFLELAEGTYTIAGSEVCVKSSQMSPLHFVSRNTGHTVVQAFSPDDFRLWYDPDTNSIKPILMNTFTADGFLPVLTSGNTDESDEWGTVLAVGEKNVGRGSVFVCQIQLAGRTTINPIAKLFARKLLME